MRALLYISGYLVSASLRAEREALTGAYRSFPQDSGGLLRREERFADRQHRHHDDRDADSAAGAGLALDQVELHKQWPGNLAGLVDNLGHLFLDGGGC
jgi:hypothetical protein